MCPLAPRNCTETRVKAQVELLIASQLWTNVNQFAQTTVDESMRWYRLTADKRWTLLLDSNTISRGYATSQGAPWHSAACVNKGDTQVNGNGRTFDPYRIKIIESISKKPQLLRSTRGTNMPNLNKHLGEKSGKMIKFGILWLLFIFLTYTLWSDPGTNFDF